MKITGKLNYISDGDHGVGILVSGHDGFINTKDSIDAITVNKKDLVTVDVQVVNKNGKTYYNFKAADLVPAAAGDVATSSKPAAAVAPTKGGYNPNGARIGMALNNAALDSRATDNIGNKEYLIKQAKFYLDVTDELENPSADAATDNVATDVLDKIDFSEAS